MNFTKQTLYIAKPSKQKDLQMLLSTIATLSENADGCTVCEVYGCDEESNEFLLYEEWKSESLLKEFKNSAMYKDFELKSKEVLRRVEHLRLD